MNNNTNETNMKRTLLILAFTLLSLSVWSQDFTPKGQIDMSKWTQKDSLEFHFLNRLNQKAAPTYKLYKTQNMWTFLELETTTGKIWQVQFSTKGDDYRYKVVVNSENLAFWPADQYSGRFELYPTENIYNFILLDTANGNTWQVQWSSEAENRGIVRIMESLFW